jgi:Cu(I)/Ag(I) efflux system membrane fusion protein
MRLYSQPIGSAANEYLATLGTRGDPGSARGSRQRLLNLGVPAQLVAEIERKHEVPPIFTWYAPRDGIVLERNVVEGQRVTPGEVLFRMADHSVV